MNNTMTIEPKAVNKNKKAREERLFGSNPIIRKITRINERSAEHVTFAGISNKCIYFMLTLILGVLAAIILQNAGRTVSLGALDVKGFTLALSSVSIIGASLMGVAAILMVVIPIISFFMRKSAAVLGTVYCFSTGYVLAFMTCMIEEYRAAVAIALIITVAVCTAMFLLYRTGKVTVNNKFRTVVITLVAADILGAIAILVCSFIPGLRFIAAFAMSNSIIAIIGAVIGVVLATLLLLVDFDGITKAVENELPVEYEWYCAFGLAFSVIWLFMKVLEVVLKVMAKKK